MKQEAPQPRPSRTGTPALHGGVHVKARVTTPFGFDTTAADVIDGVDLTGRTAIVTGALSGIGVETARALAAAGASVTLAVRNTSFRRSGRRRDQRQHRQWARSRVGAIDLSDLSSVAAFVRAWTGPLDILVNNAGVMAVPELTISPSGHEMQFAANHLGHFALAVGSARRARRRGQGPESCRSVRQAICAHRSCSTTSTMRSATTTRSAPTDSPRPPTCCSPSRPPGAGPTTASPPNALMPGAIFTRPGTSRRRQGCSGRP